MWFDKISFRDFPWKLESVGRTVAAAAAETAAGTDQKQLEQLKRLRSEIPPVTPWLTRLVIHIRSQVKQDNVKITKSKLKVYKIAKSSNFKMLQ